MSSEAASSIAGPGVALTLPLNANMSSERRWCRRYSSLLTEKVLTPSDMSKCESAKRHPHDGTELDNFRPSVNYSTVTCDLR